MRGERHTFTSRLVSGQFVRISLYQRDIDVTVSIASEDGTVRTSWNPSAFGLENHFFVATLTGNFRVEVGTADNSTKSGSYQLRMGIPRRSRPEDEKRIQAQVSFAKG